VVTSAVTARVFLQVGRRLRHQEETIHVRIIQVIVRLVRPGNTNDDSDYKASCDINEVDNL
jgi:hypothetical protein